MFIFITLVVLVLIFVYTKPAEHFNEQSGNLCLSCNDKNIAQCLECFNCVWIYDQFGQGKCVVGSQSGPYNNEENVRWYHRDPWSQMVKDNNHYKCSYGPKQSNRIIGV